MKRLLKKRYWVWGLVLLGMGVVCGHKRILYTSGAEFYGRGQLRYIEHLLRDDGLKEEYEVAVACPRTSNVCMCCEERGVKHFTVEFPSKWTRTYGAAKVMRRIYNEYKPDIVHVNGKEDHLVCAVATVGSEWKPKLVRTVHNDQNVLRDLYHQTLYNDFTDFNIFVCEYSKALNPSVQSGRVITNRVDLEHFRPGVKSLKLMDELGIPYGSFVVGSCGGLSDHKRPDLFLEVAKRLGDESNVHIVALGDRAEYWQRRADAAGVSHIVHFVGHQKDIRPVCHLFDVGMLLSDSEETISYAAREMMAMGLPLILSSFGGLKENVSDGVDGVLVEPGNVEEVVHAIHFYCTMGRVQLKRHQEAARRKAEGEFDVRDQLRETKEVYRELLSGV